MDRPDLAKIRRFALVVPLILCTLVLAGVKLDTPLRVEPLGIPLLVQRPDLLSVGLVIAAIYSTLRYVYYGMLIQPSPMRARRELIAGGDYMTFSSDVLQGFDETRADRARRELIAGGDYMTFSSDVLQGFDETRADFQRKIDRWFPQIGTHKVTFEVTLSGGQAKTTPLNVPRPVQMLCWLEDLDFLLPIGANIAAVGLWIVSRLW